MIPLDSSLGDLLSFHYYNMIDDDLLFPLTTVSVRNIDISISIISFDISYTVSVRNIDISISIIKRDFLG